MNTTQILEFKISLREVLNATYSDLYGLIESPDDMEAYKDNYILSAIDNAVLMGNGNYDELVEIAKSIPYMEESEFNR